MALFFMRLQYFSLFDAERRLHVCGYRPLPSLDPGHNKCMCYLHMALNNFTKRSMQPRNLPALCGA